ncbi:MAG: hypothetical protein AB1778_05005 [Candidatus Bipolaricaulota bacterium]
MLNRCALTTRAKGPFLDWIRSLPEPAEITLEQLREDGIAFLLPELDEEDDLESILPQCFDLLFEAELSLWSVDESEWPQDRSLDVFLRWFDVELRSVVVDLVDAPLCDDEA